CERTYEQHHEDIKNKLHMELSEIYTAEKEQLCQSYEEKISQLQMQVNEMNQELTAVQECYIAVCKEKDSLEDTLGNDLKMKLQVQEEKIKRQYLEEKENALQTLKADLEDKHLSTLSEVKAFWQKEKETEMNKRVNVQVVLAKENWIKEQQQLTEKTIQEIENKWKDKLEQTLLNAKAKARQDLEDHAIQTEESQMVFVAEQIDDLKLKLQKALEEKEQAVRKVQMELETRHHDSISKQVELAVTKARTRWLQELTSLSEYKANLKLEQEKWGKKSEQKIIDALSAAEENWRSRNDHADFNIKHKELEEKLASVKKELELKNEEYHALLKVELAKARAQWNKEKQEEMHHFQSQNEKDYCAFLDDHRNKISEALLLAKEDFEKQKKDLITHKDAEMKEQLDQHLKQWTSEESHRLLVREKEILAQLEQIMGEVPKELIDRSFVNDRSHVTSNFDGNFFEKLRALVQRSMKVTVYKILKNQKQEFKKQKYEETQMNLKANTSEYDSASNRDLLIKGTKVTCLEKNTHGKNGTTEYPCCEHCFQLLEKSRKECHELRNKLDKACRHLQQAVKEQKLKADKFRENESITENLRKENSELQKKLEDTNAVINSPSNRTEEGCEKSCSLCKGNALEEMRTQYIKAVDKIKNDMLRYIHESKSRAAEMLKSEVLRERQETARKMRKYYLTCLQQLLKDDGKNEG
ncbi:centrosomal protein of 152 kDa-like, partial [Bombina bombina]|uniref:centrosomal protein of 152 kDa-like n=1 Tax=Bombina bombina TaxID=8345 RepID=UPI00235B1CAB